MSLSLNGIMFRGKSSSDHISGASSSSDLLSSCGGCWGGFCGVLGVRGGVGSSLFIHRRTEEEVASEVV